MKKLMCIMMASVMTLTLAACGGSSSESSESTAAEGFEAKLDTSTEATLYVDGSWGNFEALEQVVLDFQEYYPNVEIVYSQLEDYGTNIVNRLTTGEEIDLFMFSGWNFNESNFNELVEHCEALDDIGIDISSLDDEYADLYSEDGKHYAFPLYQSSGGMMVNIDLLKDNGLEVPTTLDELLSACETLKGAGYETPLWIEPNYLRRCYATECIEMMKEGTSAEDAATALDVEAQALVDSGYMNPESGTLEDTYNAVILRFFEGDIPFVFIHADNFSGTAKREAKSEAFTANPFEYAYVPAPIGDTTAKYTVNGAASYYMGVYSGSQNLDMANEFLRFMYTEEEMTVLETIKNMPVANKNVGLSQFPYLESAERETLIENGLSDLTTIIDGTNAVSDYILQ